METQRTRRLLLIAFALSIVVHAVIALRMQWPFASPRDETQIVSVEHRPRVVRISKMPTPTPPSPQPPKTPSPTSAPARAKPRPISPSGIRGAVTPGTPSAPSTVAAATPAPTVAPSGAACTKPESVAALVAAPQPPDIAPAVRANATNAVIRVRVKLDERGGVTDAAVAQSSGDGSLDLVAVSMARSAQYSPAYHQCKAIASTYTFSARFIPW
jgi:TonB family protein